MERDLFEPIKHFFEQEGYLCDGEVGDIDLYMEKDGLSAAVELKVTLDFKVIQQAALRQKLTDQVYIGIFRPSDLFSRAYQNKIYLLKRLGIGLIVVGKRQKDVTVIIPPVVSELSLFQQKNKRKQQALAAEFRNRKLKSNSGGINKTKLITSYREDALFVLDALFLLGEEAKTSQIKALSGIEKTTSILYNNYYGWFEGTARGQYRLTKAGHEALLEFRAQIDSLRQVKQDMNSAK